MPPRARRAVRGRREMSELHLLALLTGHDWFSVWSGEREAKRESTYPAMRAAWEDVVGAELTALHIEHYPGSRPWGFWQFEAPEPRRRVDGKPHPFTAPGYPEARKRLYYGRPNALWLPDHFEAVYECQCAYLSRLRLLTPAEQRLVRDPGWHCWEEEEDHEECSVPREQLRAWMEGAL